jgi:hypothetical protein
MSNFRSRSVQVDHFAMIPRADIPRSSFTMETTHKTTFDAGDLIPIFVDEVLPGDMFNLKMTAFCRMATPIFPIMDNLYLDTFFFFVPNRLVWDNWVKFMGQQTNPGDTIDYVTPQLPIQATDLKQLSIYDYFGLPVKGTVGFAGSYPSINALPLRAYNLIWNEWFRDENLQNSLPVNKTDSDNGATYTLKKRGKRHDYFTSALPFVQKGTAPSIPIGGTVPVITSGATPTFLVPTSSLPTTQRPLVSGNTDQNNLAFAGSNIPQGSNFPVQFGSTTGLQVNLATATSITVNALRQSFQIQKLLERDARGGTRYTEIIRSHFGVVSPDARLQRPEYLGGGSTLVNISPIAQTSATAAGATPLANLSAFGTAVASHHGFSQSFTEHGYIIGLASVRADLTYQQGLRKLWSRRTRYDYYFPVFAALGEQAILNKEIYFQNIPATDDAVFGYQERWAEYRYHPSQITGLFRSSAAQPIDAWHLSQNFTALPTLNDTFIQENPPMSRILAVGSAAAGQNFIFDSLFSIRATRPMPMYSVPGLVDHF